MKFTANRISCQTQDHVAMVGFADNEFKTLQYVLLQRCLQPSQQDLLLGHDKPHMETNDHRYSGYGCVKSGKLNRDRLTLMVSPRTMGDAFFDYDNIEVNFHVDKVQLMEIANHLRLVLGDENVQLEVSL